MSAMSDLAIAREGIAPCECGAYPNVHECPAGHPSRFDHWAEIQGAWYFCDEPDCRLFLVIDGCECPEEWDDV